MSEFLYRQVDFGVNSPDWRVALLDNCILKGSCTRYCKDCTKQPLPYSLRAQCNCGSKSQSVVFRTRLFPHTAMCKKGTTAAEFRDRLEWNRQAMLKQLWPKLSREKKHENLAWKAHCSKQTDPFPQTSVSVLLKAVCCSRYCLCGRVCKAISYTVFHMATLLDVTRSSSQIAGNELNEWCPPDQMWPVICKQNGQANTIIIAD